MEGQASTSGIDVDVHLWQQSSGSGEQMEAGSEFTNAAVRAAVELVQVEQDREMQQQKEKEDQEKERQWTEPSPVELLRQRRAKLQAQAVVAKLTEQTEREAAQESEEKEKFGGELPKKDGWFQKAEERKNAKEAVMKTDYLAPSFGASSV